MTRLASGLGALGACAVLALAYPVFAFGSRTHRAITGEAVRRALDWPDEVVACPVNTDLGAFLRFVHEEIMQAGTPDAREFARRWPTANAFDAFEARGFLDLTRDNSVRVAGIDFLPCDDDGSVLDLVAQESVRPDVDGRNLSRRAFGEDRQPIVAARGPLPEDPMILDLGGLDGLASQAHAHYLLAEEPGGWFARGAVARRLSSNPLDLWKDPAHFALATAVPGGPFTLGADMAMEHFLLALLASSWADPAARRLSLAFLGHALHYVQDASDPLHTVQVGHACVAWHGAVAFAGRAVVTAGGYLGALRGPTVSITDVVSNLHLWTEAFWDARDVVSFGGGWVEAWSAVSGFPSGWGGLFAAWRGAEVVRAKGPVLYRAACRAVCPEVLEYGAVLEDGRFVAETLLCDEAAGLEVERIGREAALVALAESVAMIRAFAVLEARMHEIPVRRKVAAMLATRMRAVAQREERLAAWKERHPEGAPPRADSVRMPVVLALELGLPAVAVFLLARRLRRRSGWRVTRSGASRAG